MKLNFFRPRRVTDDEWEALAGTSLYDVMFRNKLCVSFENLELRSTIRDDMKAWLDKNCKGRYFIARVYDPLSIFFEIEAEQILFETYFSTQHLPDTTKETQSTLETFRKNKRAAQQAIAADDADAENPWGRESFGG